MSLTHSRPLRDNGFDKHHTQKEACYEASLHLNAYLRRCSDQDSAAVF
jgi:hypothetical protein